MDLIKIQRQNGKQTVSGRELHRFLEVGKDFSSWIKLRIKTFRFEENEDYIVFTKSGENSLGGRPSKEYHLSLDMAKELSMVENNDKGREARRYFINIEKRASLQIQSNDPIMMLAESTLHLRKAQIEQSEQLNEHSGQIQSLEEKVDSLHSTSARRDLIVETPPAGYQNKTDVIENVANITCTTKAIVEEVLNFYKHRIMKDSYFVEIIDGVRIVKNYTDCFFISDVIECVYHALERSEKVSDCFSIFPTLGNGRKKVSSYLSRPKMNRGIS